MGITSGRLEALSVAKGAGKFFRLIRIGVGESGSVLTTFFGCVGFCVSWVEGTDVCGVGLSENARVWLQAAAKVSKKTGSKKRAGTFMVVDTMHNFPTLDLRLNNCRQSKV
ncbi:hypothetical protein [uncultured Nostoc sp.]|uniref:hypothetical protein n=1 Tax=uncultured Nostoc sp. TaxID=340711 RepID=UPI0025CDD338|nr:hypothetical protein [Nostoc sp. NMS8]